MYEPLHVAWDEENGVTLELIGAAFNGLLLYGDVWDVNNWTGEAFILADS